MRSISGIDRGPALLRGAADEWAAIREWSLGKLVLDHGQFLGTVRIANGRTFRFCEVHHPDVLRGIVNPPRYKDHGVTKERSHSVIYWYKDSAMMI